VNAPSFLTQLSADAPLILDGATGTELTRRGVDTSLPLWSAGALIHAPDTLRAIHADYVRAGAQLITSNTFRTHRRSLAKAGLGGRARELTHRAVQLVREAIQQANQPTHPPVLIAGSIAPLEDCYSPQLVPPDDELEAEHAEMARHLAEAGADVLLVETMNTLREAVIAAAAALATGLPVCVSFVAGPGGRAPDGPIHASGEVGEEMTLLSGEPIEPAASAVRRLNPAVVMVNCVPLNLIEPAFDRLRAASAGRVGVYANIGHADDSVGWILTDDVRPDAYARHARRWLEHGASIIGGCCGTTPDHIAALHAMRCALDL